MAVGAAEPTVALSVPASGGATIAVAVRPRFGAGPLQPIAAAAIAARDVLMKSAKRGLIEAKADHNP
jgi:hypothetical protein